MSIPEMQEIVLLKKIKTKPWLVTILLQIKLLKNSSYLSIDQQPHFPSQLNWKEFQKTTSYNHGSR